MLSRGRILLGHRSICKSTIIITQVPAAARAYRRRHGAAAALHTGTETSAEKASMQVWKYRGSGSGGKVYKGTICTKKQSQNLLKTIDFYVHDAIIYFTKRKAGRPERRKVRRRAGSKTRKQKKAQTAKAMPDRQSGSESRAENGTQEAGFRR
jgi:hypothetical protein